MSAATAFSPIRSSRPALILLIGVVVGNLPLFGEHLLNLWKQPQYQYFPIVLLVIGWLIWRSAAWRSEPLTSRVSVPLGAAVLVVSLLIAFFGTKIMSPWIATFSLVLAFGGVLLVLRNWLFIENPIGIWCLSFLVLKPPLGLDTKLAFWLQGVTSRVAGSLLDMAGVVNLVEGNTIVLQERHLFVEEACSGIVSLMSIIACCAIIAVWQNRPAPHAILLTISGAFWAGILNIFRITIMAIALDMFGVDMTEGWRHEALGLTLFAGTLGLSFCTDRFLLFFLTPIATAESQVYGKYATDQNQHLLSRLWNYAVEPGSLFFKPQRRIDSDESEAPGAPRLRIPSWMIVFGVLFVGVSITQVVRGALSKDNFERVEPAPAILAMTQQSMPATVGELTQRDFGSETRKVGDILGEKSHHWTYGGPGYAVLFSLDFVFLEFHELTMCYEGIGWKIAGRRTIKRPGTDQVFVVAQFGKDTGEHAYLIFGSFDGEGRNIAPPDSSLTSGLQARMFKSAAGIPGGAYQTQALVQTASELAAPQRKDVLNAFFQFYDRMAQTVRGN